jgi:hypothetical protein
MDSIQENKRNLQALTIDDQASKIMDSTIRELLFSEDFWGRVAAFLTLLKPVADAITAAEGDTNHLSVVAKTLSELEASFAVSIVASPVLQSEEEALKLIIPKRRRFLMKPIHLAANLLDPRFKGSHISPEEAVSNGHILSRFFNFTKYSEYESIKNCMIEIR